MADFECPLAIRCCSNTPTRSLPAGVIPLSEPQTAVRFDIHPTGTPSVGQALLRIILAIPHLIVLALLGIVAGLLILIAAIMILVQESYPSSIYGFLRGYLRWHARVLAYLASLVDEYPPFALDTESETLQLLAAGTTR